jgi:hypothetical protein
VYRSHDLQWYTVSPAIAPISGSANWEHFGQIIMAVAPFLLALAKHRVGGAAILKGFAAIHPDHQIGDSGEFETNASTRQIALLRIA